MIFHGVSRGSGRGVSPPRPIAMSWLAGEPCLHVAPLDRAEQPAFWSGDDRGMQPAAAERSANSALTAAIWHNHKTGQPVLRSLIAYDHS